MVLIQSNRYNHTIKLTKIDFKKMEMLMKEFMKAIEENNKIIVGILSQKYGFNFDEAIKEINTSTGVPTDVVVALDVPTDVVVALDVPTDVVVALDVPTDVAVALDVPTDVVVALDVPKTSSSYVIDKSDDVSIIAVEKTSVDSIAKEQNRKKIIEEYKKKNRERQRRYYYNHKEKMAQKARERWQLAKLAIQKYREDTKEETQQVVVITPLEPCDSNVTNEETQEVVITPLEPCDSNVTNEETREETITPLEPAQDNSLNVTNAEKRGCRKLSKCLTNEQRIMHIVAKNKKWIGVYNSLTNRIMHDGKEYKTISAFAVAHKRKELTHRTGNITADGWIECKCEVNGTFVSMHNLPVLSTA